MTERKKKAKNSIRTLCALIDNKIRRLMIIICDPVTLCLIFIHLIPIIKKKYKNTKIIVKKQL